MLVVVSRDPIDESLRRCKLHNLLTISSGQALGLVASWLVEKNTNSYVDFYGLVNWLVRRLPFY